jgi:hypothetical protein
MVTEMMAAIRAALAAGRSVIDVLEAWEFDGDGRPWRLGTLAGTVALAALEAAMVQEGIDTDQHTVDDLSPSTQARVLDLADAVIR